MTIRTPESYGTWWDESAQKAYSQLPDQPTAGEADTIAIEEDVVHISGVDFHPGTEDEDPYASSWTSCQVAVANRDDFRAHVTDIDITNGEFSAPIWTNNTGETGEARVWVNGADYNKTRLYINKVQDCGPMEYEYAGNYYSKSNFERAAGARVMPGDFLSLYSTDTYNPEIIDHVYVRFRPDTYPLP